MFVYFFAAPASPAVASGAITVSDPLMEAVNSPSRPKIPDRKTKPTSGDLPRVPTVDRSSIASMATDTTRASVGSEFNKAILEDSTYSSDIESSSLSNVSSQPPIDRSLKAKALMKSARPTTQNEVLEAEKDIVEESLRMETEELKMEQEWENLRLRKENAVNEELRFQVLDTYNLHKYLF